MGYCVWAGMNEANRTYHNTEWGIPLHDDRHMFEHLTLECLQCGLSWDLMLKKREIFRGCFDNFDYDKIADYDDTDVERILSTEGMIRSPRKVQAVINNARCYKGYARSTVASVIISGASLAAKRFCTKDMTKALSRSATASPTGSVKTSRSAGLSTWEL